MFGDIAGSYDLLNHLLSLNIDRYWRCRARAWRRRTPMAPFSTFAPAPATWPWLTTAPLTEVCRSSVPTFVCRCCCRPVTRRARCRAADRIRFLEADTQRLPFADDYFQLATVAFGLRNVTDTDKGIAEMVPRDAAGRTGGDPGVLTAAPIGSSGRSIAFISGASCPSSAKSFAQPRQRVQLSAGQRDAISGRRRIGREAARAWIDGGEMASLDVWDCDALHRTKSYQRTSSVNSGRPR